MNIDLRRFLHNHGNIATEGSRDYALLLFRMTTRVLYSAQYHRQHCTFHAFEQFETLYTHSPMTNIRPDRDLNLQPPGYKPQSIRMSHRDRPVFFIKYNIFKVVCNNLSISLTAYR